MSSFPLFFTIPGDPTGLSFGNTTNPVRQGWFDALYLQNKEVAVLDSPSLTNAPTTTTPNSGDSSSRIPNTLWVGAEISSALTNMVTSGGGLSDGALVAGDGGGRGVRTGPTQAFLLDRANHTGVLPASAMSAIINDTQSSGSTTYSSSKIDSLVSGATSTPTSVSDLTAASFAAGSITGNSTSDVVTGSAGANGTYATWNSAGDLTSTAAPALALSNISQIPSALLTGDDDNLVSGTAGAADRLSKWNSDGDLVGTTLQESDVTNPTQVSTLEKSNGTETELRGFAPVDIKSMIDTHSVTAGLPAQVSSGEITAGTETNLRSTSPADIVGFIATHGGSASLPAQVSAGEISTGTTTATRLHSPADVVSAVRQHSPYRGPLIVATSNDQLYLQDDAYIPLSQSASARTLVHTSAAVYDWDQWDEYDLIIIRFYESSNPSPRRLGSAPYTLNLLQTLTMTPNEHFVEATLSAEVPANSTLIVKTSMSYANTSFAQGLAIDWELL